MQATILEASEFNKPFWLDWQIDHASTRYNLHSIYQLSPELNIDKLFLALNKVVLTHYNLRSTFKEINGQLKQYIAPHQDVTLARYTVHSSDESSSLIKQLCGHHFHLEKGPLFQFILIHNKPANHYLFLIHFHHIIVDGQEVDNIVTKINQYYFNIEKPALLDESGILSHQQYIAHEKNILAKKNDSSWIQYLENYEFSSELPYDTAIDSNEKYSVNSINYTMDSVIYEKLIHFKNLHPYSLFQIIKTTWAFVLSRYCGNQPIVLSHPVSIRRPQYQELKGAFVNTVLFYYSESESFLDQLKKTRSQVKLHQNRNLPILHLLEKIKNIMPHVDTQSLLKLGIAETNLRVITEKNGLFEKSIPVKDLATAELALEYEVIQDSLQYRINFLDHLFSQGLIDQISTHFQSALNYLLDHPNQETSCFSLLTSIEHKKIVNDLNKTETFIPTLYLHEFFEVQAKRVPHNKALFCTDSFLTYHDLKLKSDLLAQSIIRHYRQYYNRDAVDGDIVGIYMDYSLEMIVSLIAIMKAGAAYLPLDRNHPDERIQWMIEDAQASALIVNSSIETSSWLTQATIPVIHYNTLEDHAHQAYDLPRLLNPLAYVIYTSGTTGKPKGVPIRQRSAVNTIQAMNKILKLTNQSKVLQFVSFGFDVFVQDVFCTLSQGACLYLPSRWIKQDFHLLNDYIQAHQIDYILGLPAAALEALPSPENTSLQKIVIGGETPTIKSLDRWISKVDLINAYGPTEAAICVTYHPYQSGDAPAIIGKPIDNMKVYVLDPNLNPVPMRVKGELYVGGIGLSVGYLHLPEATQQCFIKNPFHSLADDAYAMLYKTGDIVRWRFDETLEYSHRNDQQIKLRGYRIELNEIEVLLNHYHSIQQCVVTVAKAETHHYLIAYYVSTVSEAISTQELKAYLSRSLPYYMIPAEYIKIESMPLSVNGKVDRKALDKYQLTLDCSSDSVLLTKMEIKLLAIWRDLLKVKSITINDHFLFIGGHSLVALALVNRIKLECNVSITVKEVFEYPILSQMAKYIEDLSCTPALNHIKKVENQKFYVSSAAQSSLYFINQTEESTHALFNFPLILELNNTLKVEDIRNAFKVIVERHEMLRTSFHFIDGRVVQQVHEPFSPDITVISLKAEEILSEIERVTAIPFSLAHCPLFQIYFFETASACNILLFNAHHIIIDGESAQILVRDLNQIISNELLVPLQIQYRDYAEHQHVQLKNNHFEKQKDYWLSHIQDDVVHLPLPMDYPEAQNINHHGAQHSIKLGDDVAIELKKFCDHYHLTTNSVLFSVFAILLHKYTLQNEIIIGLPATNRTHAELNNLIGMFINMLSIKVTLLPESLILNLIKNIQNTIILALSHQEYPFEELVKSINNSRQSHQNPIFNVVFNYNTILLQHTDLIQFSKHNTKMHSTAAKFDLCLTLYQIQEAMQSSYWICFDYSTTQFSHETIERFTNNYVLTLRQVLNQCNAPLSALDIISAHEKNQLLNQWCYYSNSFSMPQSLVAIIEAQSNITPYQTAIKCDNRILSYMQLNQSANQLAHYIRQIHLSNHNQSSLANRVIGLYLPRGIEAIVTIVAILKSGAAYLPLDLDLPFERLNFIVEDANCIQVLSLCEYAKHLQGLSCIVSYIDEQANVIQNQSDHNLALVYNENDLAYVMYTSGTTGKPKGTLIQHNNVMNLIYNIQKKFPLDIHSNVSQFSSLSFDGSIAEIFPTLAFGARLIVIPDEVRSDSQLFYTFILDNNINMILFLPPMILSNLALLPKNRVKVIIIGGDVCAKKTMDQWAERTQLVNGYGPTETTVYAALGLHQCGHRITLGKPLDNVQILILDEMMKVLPIGAIGEIFISGAGVSRGYLNLPQLSQTKFLDHDLAKHSKLYRTGDYGRWLSDGTIEYLGRQDSHIKLRGFRIELSEIETILETHSSIQQCVVCLKQNENNKYLAAYYIVKEPVDRMVLIEYLSRKLPHYMLPSFFIELKEFPLTRTGKIDRKQLPDPGISFVDNHYILDSQEQKIKLLFCEILGIDHLSPEDSFFQLGGHSLSAMQLANEIKKVFQVDLPTKLIFHYPTIRNLSKILSQLSKDQYQPITPVTDHNMVEATSVQRGIYLHHHSLGDQSLQYNLAMYFKITFPSDAIFSKLNNVMNQLINMHDIFRMSFHLKQGKLLIKLNHSLNFSLEEIDFRHDNDLDIIEHLPTMLAKPFSLDKAPLLRALLFHTKQNECFLAIVSHHIILDGTSLEILQSNFEHLFHDKNIIQAKCQFLDYANYQNNLIKNNVLAAKKQFWKNVLPKEPTRLKWPLDFARTSQTSADGLHFSTAIPARITKQLRQISTELQITEHTLLFSALPLVLQPYSETSPLLIGVPVYGRSHPDAINIVGMFANTLCIPVTLQLNDSPLEYLATTNEFLLTAYENQDYPLDDLIDAMKLSRQPARHPLFDVMFSYQRFKTKHHNSDSHIERIDVRKENIHVGSIFDLSFYITEDNERNLNLTVQYRSSLFKPETISQLSMRYCAALNWLLENVNQPVKLQHFIPDDIVSIPTIKKPSIDNKPAYNDPLSTIEHDLVEIWKEALGINDFSIGDNFFDLGGNSLSAMYMLELVSEKFPSTSISLFHFQENPTIINLREQLSIQSEVIEHRYIIPLQPQGSQKPLFILPGFIGFSTGYKDLADIIGNEKTQPIYGIQMQGILQNDTPLNSIAEIAQQNIDWIRSIQPEGPYKIMGHSFGALVAYEMVKLLENQNISNNLVIILDSGPHALVNNKIRTEKSDCIRIILSILHFLLPTPIVAQLHHDNKNEMNELFKKLMEFESIDHSVEYVIQYLKNHSVAVQINQFYKIFELAKTNAGISYMPTSFLNSDVVLVRTQFDDVDIYSHHSDDSPLPCLGWSQYYKNVRVLTSTGNHITMVKSPHINSYVTQLMEHLQEVENTCFIS